MPTDLTVPEVGESITEVQIGQWLKKPGDPVKKDDVLVEIETDKVTQELYAPTDGVIAEILHQQGAEVPVGEIIGRFDEGASAAPDQADRDGADDGVSKNEGKGETTAGPKAGSTPPTGDVDYADTSRGKSADDGASGGAGTSGGTGRAESSGGATSDGDLRIMPAAKRLLDENNLDASSVKATGPGNRLLKEDVQAHLKNPPTTPTPSAEPASAGVTSPKTSRPSPQTPNPSPQPPASEGREEEAVPMTSLRKRIAANLVQAQQTAALLTTFNEIDMTAVMSLRTEYKDAFEKTHGVKLGFMSFFVKASIDALKQSPAINAEVRDNDIIYKNYYDIGIAIGGGKGLVVPILRNAERMSFADIEKTIGELAGRAKNNKLTLDELTGGTFTITNGGIYGSLLSTPIVNPPQSGVLGMHGIVRRPIAVDPGTPKERIEIRPMMYVALTYDHRIVDGREAVTALKRIKDTLEAPARMLMEV